MKKAILGKKLGMTQIFGENDVAIPVTVVQCGPMTVVDTRTVERNGYSAVVCAFEEIKEGKLNKPEAGLYKRQRRSPRAICASSVSRTPTLTKSARLSTARFSATAIWLTYRA